MSLISKLFTAIRGAGREAGEAVVDANSLRILEQEIKDAERDRDRAKNALADLMAKQMAEERKANELAEQIREYEAHAKKAHEQGNAELVDDVVGRISELEQQHGEHDAAARAYAERAETMKAQIRKVDSRVRECKREMEMVRSTEAVQKAESSLSDNVLNSDSSMNSAMSSLERIKQRQQQHADRQKAATILSEEETDDLDRKLKDAGISGDKSASSQEDIRARLGLK